MANSDYIKTEVRRRVLAIFPEARIVFFGSRARDDARMDSDWDFLAIVGENVWSPLLSDHLRDSIFELSTETGEDIMVIVETKEHVWKFQLSPFHQNIKNEGIEL